MAPSFLSFATGMRRGNITESCAMLKISLNIRELLRLDAPSAESANLQKDDLVGISSLSRAMILHKANLTDIVSVFCAEVRSVGTVFFELKGKD